MILLRSIHRPGFSKQPISGDCIDGNLFAVFYWLNIYERNIWQVEVP